MSTSATQVSLRDLKFTDKVKTRIWLEKPAAGNPYLEEKCYCHGYDLAELMRNCNYPDMVHLLFRGELPSNREKRLLEALMVSFCNPGPRHPATRAAMIAGVGKTERAHILPLGMMVLGGVAGGAAEVEECMRFLKKHLTHKPYDLARQLIAALDTSEQAGDVSVAPGFGNRFGAIDPMAASRAAYLSHLCAPGTVMDWAQEFSLELNAYGMGWLSTGVIAAVLLELGFQPRAGAGMYQLICAPGLLAHGVEMANKPITDFPFVSDADYVIEK